MEYKKNVNRLLNWISEQSKIPKESLHLINVTPEMLDKALITCIKNKIPIHKAEEYVKSLWRKSGFSQDDKIKEGEMELMGFVRVDGQWKNTITDTIVTDDQVKTMTFKEVEEMVMNNPLYNLYLMYKKKFLDNNSGR